MGKIEKLILKIFAKIKKTPNNEQLYRDSFDLIREVLESDVKRACELSKELRVICQKQILKKNPNIIALAELSDKTLLLESPHVFDSYLQYLEIGRKPKDKFYLPRRKILKQVVDELQKLADDELDELFISMPPRVGKTTLIMFFNTWVLGRNSEASNLYSAYSATITNAFYKGNLEVITDNYTYRWKDVFPQSEIVETNAKDEILNLDRKKRYPSLTCRSLYGTLNGACDCNGFLISDDLIGGIEEALNKDRLVAAWSKVDNNLIPRAKENAKLVWIGTRWSMFDPAGIRMSLLENDEAYRDKRITVINIPALDPVTDESNFDYDYGVGFSTEYYRQRRASFERNNDMASWFSQYMGEPIERDGALFDADGLRYFNGVMPSGEPDRIFMFVDPAWGGGDYVSAPIAYQYGDDVYIPDVIFDLSDKYVTRPRVVDKILKHNVGTVRFEANNGGEDYKEWVEEELKSRGYRLNITSRLAPSNKRKEQRIFDKAPEIREFYFLENGKRDKEYQAFINNLLSFKITGKNKNDDAPDSLAGLADMANGLGKVRFEIFNRPF